MKRKKGWREGGERGTEPWEKEFGKVWGTSDEQSPITFERFEGRKMETGQEESVAGRRVKKETSMIRRTRVERSFRKKEGREEGMMEGRWDEQEGEEEEE